MTQSHDSSSTREVRRLLSRRGVLGGMIAAPVVLKGFSPAYAQSMRKVKMAAQNPLQLSDYPAFIAQRFGMFKKHGIDAEFVLAANAMLPLLAGEIDITTVGSLNGLLPINRKQDFQFIATTISKVTASIIVRPDSPIAPIAHKWPDVFTALRGKQLGVTIPGGLNDLVARFVSNKAGLKPDKDITITPAGDAVVLMGNLEKGLYDAAMQVSPLFERAVERKVAVTVMDFYKGEGPNPEINLIGGGSPGTRKSFAEKNPDLINAYIQSMQEAVEFAAKPDNRKEMLTVIASELKVEPATLERPIETFIAAVARNVKFSRAQWDVSVDVMKVNGIIQDAPAYEDGVYVGARA